MTLDDIIEATRKYAPIALDEADNTSRRQGAVYAAVERFSIDVPDIQSVELYDNPVVTSDISGWVDRWSKPIEAFWPYLSGDTPAIEDPELSEGEIELSINTDGNEELRFLNAFPDSGSPILLRFNTRWSIDSPITLPDAYEQTISVLASYIYVKSLIGVLTDRTRVIPDGVVEITPATQVAELTTQADQLLSLYNSMIGKVKEGE